MNAARAVMRPYLNQGDRPSVTLLGGELTAWGEGTSRHDHAPLGWSAGNRAQPSRPRLRRQASNESHCVRMFRVEEDIVGRSFFDQFSVVHNPHPVAYTLHDPKVV